MLLSNAFRPDPRVAREAAALVQADLRVTLVCWDRERQRPARETVDGYRIQRIHEVPAAYGAGARQILNTPRFWRAAVRRAGDLRPDVIHCHDLDTLPAGWWLKKKTGARLVYDAHEDYPALMSLYLPRPMVRALSWLERWLLRHVDHTLTASRVFADKLRACGVSPVTTIGNYHPLEPYDRISRTDTQQARTQLGLGSDDLVVAYIGGFSRNRLLLPLIEAAHELPDVQVLLWGDGHQRSDVEAAAMQANNVRYMGWLPTSQVPLYMKMADVIYYCLKPDYPGAVYNAPNTLSQTMAAGRPVIANDVGDLGRIVRETACGRLLSGVTALEIQKAVDDLRDPVLRQRLGEAGRRAAETEYNWDSTKRCLQTIYARLGGY
jgi:glycosyltransferase involved in cell wall biosynthesis